MTVPSLEMRRLHLVLRTTRLLSLALFVALLFLLLGAEAASAGIRGDCTAADNWAIINGTRYTPANDTRENPVVVPAGETISVEYNGTTTAGITDHSGQIAVDLGFGNVIVEPWSHPNKPEPETTKHGVKEITIPNVPGIYDITGFHRGTGGQCSGEAVLKIEGNPLTTPAGAGAVGGTALAGGGLLAAAFARPRKGVA